MAGARYVRYIAFALLSLVVIFFISSSSAPVQVGHHLQTTTNTIKDKLKGSKLRSSTSHGSIGVPPSVDLHDIDKIPVESPSAPIPAPPVEAGPRKSHPHEKQKGLKSPKGSKGLKGTKAHRMNATFVTLARNSDIHDIGESIRAVEDRFNHRFNYDWVFLNDQPFDDDFIRLTTNLVSGKTKYGLIPEEHWSFPDWIDQDKAAEVRKDMGQRKIIYGDSISYRHMCRFESGFFFQQPLLMEYEWYWRVEPSIKLYCDVDYDVFKFMADNKKKYSFTLSLYEYRDTIPTLWDNVKTFMKEFPEHIAEDNAMEFLSNDDGNTYNLCHFWSNFEIGNLDWLRSPAYTDFFNHLDEAGGFFYERWGDAPVHSIAAGLLLQKDEIHFFNDIGYYHVPFYHCPNEPDLREKGRCVCKPNDNFDWNGYSCLARYYDMHDLPHPKQH